MSTTDTIGHIVVYPGDENIGKEITCRAKKKYVYDDENIKLCFQADLSSAQRDWIGYLVIHAKYNKFNNAYYYNEKKDEIFYISFRQNRAKISIQECDNIGKVKEYAEAHFSGKGANEIFESPKEIKKDHGPSHTREITLLLSVILIVGGFYFYLTKPEESIIKPKPPMPYYPSLTKMEKLKLKNVVSKKIFAIMEEQLKKYTEENNSINHRRVVGFNMDAMRERALVVPQYDEDSNSWVYRNGLYPKRGGYRTNLSINLIKNFPSVGYQYSNSDKKKGDYYYSKRESKLIVSDERDLPSAKTKGLMLNKQCLIAALNLPGEVVPMDREYTIIDVRITKMAPHSVFYDVKKIIKHCPFYLKSLQLNDKGFTMLGSLDSSGVGDKK